MGTSASTSGASDESADETALWKFLARQPGGLRDATATPLRAPNASSRMAACPFVPSSRRDTAPSAQLSISPPVA
eukprot:3559062-Pleurochrysis_carterae.AAC.7